MLLDGHADGAARVVVVVRRLAEAAVLPLRHNGHVLVVLIVEVAGHDVQHLRRRDGGQAEVGLDDRHDADFDEEVAFLVVDVPTLDEGIATLERLDAEILRDLRKMKFDDSKQC